VHHHLGVSAFATHAVVSERSVVRVEEDVPPDVAALLGCAVLTGGGAVKNAGLFHPDQSLAIVGLGGVGMAALLVGVAMGGSSIAVIDSRAEKLDRARAMGASQAFLPHDIPEEFKADLVIEAAGNVPAFESAFAMIAPGGKLVTVGLPDPTARVSLSPLELVAQGKSVIGSYLGSSNPELDIPFYLDLWRQGRLPLERLVSAEISLEGINAAMDDLHRGEAIRQIIRIS
jgi:alcohol dehydrogenase